jgi:hypothetical protein
MANLTEVRGIIKGVLRFVKSEMCIFSFNTKIDEKGDNIEVIINDDDLNIKINFTISKFSLHFEELKIPVKFLEFDFDLEIAKYIFSELKKLQEGKKVIMLMFSYNKQKLRSDFGKLFMELYDKDHIDIDYDKITISEEKLSRLEKMNVVSHFIDVIECAKSDEELKQTLDTITCDCPSCQRLLKINRDTSKNLDFKVLLDKAPDFIKSPMKKVLNLNDEQYFFKFMLNLTKVMLAEGESK